MWRRHHLKQNEICLLACSPTRIMSSSLWIIVEYILEAELPSMVDLDDEYNGYLIATQCHRYFHLLSSLLAGGTAQGRLLLQMVECLHKKV